MEFFEPFWDSGEPRIGEKGAKGWKAWMHQQEKGGWIVVSKPGKHIGFFNFYMFSLSCQILRTLGDTINTEVS